MKISRFNACRQSIHNVSIRFMQTEQIVALLVAERDRLNRAIEALGSPVKHRGRPAKAAAPAPTVSAAPTTRRKRAPMSAAARKEQSARMKAFWAARREKSK
jgi:hypothetical protein